MTPYTACLDHTNARTKLMHHRSLIGDAFMARIEAIVNASTPARQIARFEWLLAEVNPVDYVPDDKCETWEWELRVEDELRRLEECGWKGRRE